MSWPGEGNPVLAGVSPHKEHRSRDRRYPLRKDLGPETGRTPLCTDKQKENKTSRRPLYAGGKNLTPILMSTKTQTLSVNRASSRTQLNVTRSLCL